MSKKRMIHDCIWQSEGVAGLDYRARLLWIGLITTADDQGRGRAHPGLVRAAVFPYDIITQDEIEADMQAIAELGMLLIYQVEDKVYYQVEHWWDYQSPQWVGPSDYPAPEGWDDRLRYHGKGHHVITQNWPGTADIGVNDKADEPARKSADPSPREREEEEVKERELHGDTSSPGESKSRQPSPHDVVRAELEAHFSKLTGLPSPKTDTQSQRRSAGALWWSPLREIAELCEWDTPRAIKLIDTTVAHLQGNVTIASPKSILKTAQAAATGNMPGSNDGKPIRITV